ncbi:hypothetical protein ABQF34_03100 [Mycolicibacterium boenickei]
MPAETFAEARAADIDEDFLRCGSAVSANPSAADTAAVRTA